MPRSLALTALGVLTLSLAVPARAQGPGTIRIPGVKREISTDTKSLDLSETKVEDAGLNELAALKNLTKLNLDSTPVKDAGLKELAVIKSLTYLSLGGTEVTDAGLKELALLKGLTYLDLFNTEVTDAGARNSGTPCQSAGSSSERVAQGTRARHPRRTRSVSDGVSAACGEWRGVSPTCLGGTACLRHAARQSHTRRRHVPRRRGKWIRFLVWLCLVNR